MAGFLMACIRKGVGISVENPTRSLMWLTPWFKALLKMPGVFRISFQNCMHGGTRPKWSDWATNVEQLRSLTAHCDGSHRHEPWSVSKSCRSWEFSTSAEAEYPALLCTRAAKRIRLYAVSEGLDIKEDEDMAEEPKDNTVSSSSAYMAGAGRQPRGKIFPEMIPEFKCTIKRYFSRS